MFHHLSDDVMHVVIFVLGKTSSKNRVFLEFSQLLVFLVQFVVPFVIYGIIRLAIIFSGTWKN